MKEITYKKIPINTLKRLDEYAVKGFASGSMEEKAHWDDRIVTACSVLWDGGILDLSERIEVSRFYRSRVYFEKGVVLK